MDQEQPSIWGLFWGLIAPLVLCGIGGYFLSLEYDYSVRGLNGEAVVHSAQIVERRGRRGLRYEKLEVRFTYQDSSTNQPTQGDLDFDPDEQIAPGHKFPVQYLPGVPDSARHVFNTKWNFVLFGAMFAGGVGWLILEGYGLLQATNFSFRFRAISSKKKKKKQRPL